MNARSLARVLVALFALSVGASAQRVGDSRPRHGGDKTFQFGSVERTRLLQQVRGDKTKDDVLRFGSVERRAALTGARVSVPKPKYLGPRHTKKRSRP